MSGKSMKSVLKLELGWGLAKFIASLFQGYLTSSANLASTVRADSWIYLHS